MGVATRTTESGHLRVTCRNFTKSAESANAIQFESRCLCVERPVPIFRVESRCVESRCLCVERESVRMLSA